MAFDIGGLISAGADALSGELGGDGDWGDALGAVGGALGAASSGDWGDALGAAAGALGGDSGWGDALSGALGAAGDGNWGDALGGLVSGAGGDLLPDSISGAIDAIGDGDLSGIASSLGSGGLGSALGGALGDLGFDAGDVSSALGALGGQSLGPASSVFEDPVGALTGALGSAVGGAGDGGAGGALGGILQQFGTDDLQSLGSSLLGSDAASALGSADDLVHSLGSGGAGGVSGLVNTLTGDGKLDDFVGSLTKEGAQGLADIALQHGDAESLLGGLSPASISNLVGHLDDSTIAGLIQQAVRPDAATGDASAGTTDPSAAPGDAQAQPAAGQGAVRDVFADDVLAANQPAAATMQHEAVGAQDATFDQATADGGAAAGVGADEFAASDSGAAAAPDVGPAPQPQDDFTSQIQSADEIDTSTNSMFDDL